MMDVFRKVINTFVGGSSKKTPIPHNTSIDSKIEYVTALREKIEDVSAAVEEFLLFEISYADNSATMDFFQSDADDIKSNHPKRKLSDVLLKSSKDLGSKSILSKGLDSLAYLLTASAQCNDVFITELYQSFLKTLQNFYEKDLADFFTQLEELNDLKINSSRSDNYTKKTSDISKMVDDIIQTESSILLPILIKIIRSNNAYLEVSLKTNRQILVSMESLGGRKTISLDNSNHPGILYPKLPSQRETMKSVAKKLSIRKSTKPKSIQVAGSTAAVSKLKNVRRSEIVKDVEIYEFAVRSALCEYLTTELDLTDTEMDNVIDDDSEPDEVSFEEKYEIKNLNNKKDDDQSDEDPSSSSYRSDKIRALYLL